MSKFLTPRMLAERLENKVELNKETRLRFSSLLFEIIMRELKNDDSFSLFGFGSFKKNYIAPGKGRNPQTGETIDIPGHYRIKFSPAGKLADRINSEYAHLEPFILEPIILEQDDMVHEGLLLKAERYNLTATPEPETPLAAEETVAEETVAEEPAAEETAAEETAAEEETAIQEPVSEYIPHEPDFGFKKKPMSTVKKIFILLVILLLILGLGWFLFRNNTTDSATDIIVTEETLVQEITVQETVLEETEAVPEPETEPIVQDLQTAPETSYNIVPGDSFSLLAQRSWGNISLWPYLYKRNSNTFPDPDLVRPGENIVIPPEPNTEKDQISIEDSFLFAYERYRSLISEQSGNLRNPKRERNLTNVLLGGERLYPGFLDRRKSEIRIEDIRRTEDLNF